MRTFNRRVSRRAQRIRGWALGLFLLTLIATPISLCVAYKNSVVETEITVKAKDHGDNNDYIIYTEDGEVFFVEDSILEWEFGALEKYGSIDAGKTYKVKAAGWRIPFLPMHRDILEVKEVE